MILDPILFAIEDRGYGRGVSHWCLPNGTFLAFGQECPAEFVAAIDKAAFAEFTREGDT